MKILRKFLKLIKGNKQYTKEELEKRHINEILRQLDKESDCNFNIIRIK